MSTLDALNSLVSARDREIARLKKEIDEIMADYEMVSKLSDAVVSAANIADFCPFCGSGGKHREGCIYLLAIEYME